MLADLSTGWQSVIIIVVVVVVVVVVVETFLCASLRTTIQGRAQM
jgi:hypothetical protein